MPQLASAILASSHVADSVLEREYHDYARVSGERLNRPDHQLIAFTFQHELDFSRTCGSGDCLRREPFIASDELNLSINHHLRRVDALKSEPPCIFLLPS